MKFEIICVLLISTANLAYAEDYETGGGYDPIAGQLKADTQISKQKLLYSKQQEHLKKQRIDNVAIFF